MRLGLASTFPPFRGGIAQFNAAAVRALKDRGHDVESVTWSRQYPGLLFPGTTQWEPGKGTADVDMPALLDSLYPASWSRTGRHLAERCDVVVLPFWHAALAPALTGVAKSAKKHGVKHVMALMHNATSHDGKRMDRILVNRFLRQVDGVVTLSGPVSAALREWSPVTLFHPLYDHLPRGPRKEEARRQLGLSKDDVVHLFFGLIRPYKGLSVLLEAMKDLPEHHKLVVAGECYGSWEPYAEVIRKHGLESRVLIHNEFIEDDLVPIYFSAANTAVLPYTQASQSGVTALALHHEVRVVASDVGDLANTVVPELTGRLLPPGDVQALASALDQPWSAQPADVKGAFEQVKKRLSWSAWADQLTQQVEFALSGAR